jgi:hypothetical protein
MRHKVKCGRCGKWAIVKGEDRTIQQSLRGVNDRFTNHWPTDAYILECPRCGLREQPMGKQTISFSIGLRSIWTRAFRGF